MAVACLQNVCRKSRPEATLFGAPSGWGARTAMAATRLLQTTVPPLMLEREAELATLEALLAAARDGEGRLVVVEGRAGIGKTRLLGETRKLAEVAEFEVLTARGGELEGEFAFGIVRQL